MRDNCLQSGLVSVLRSRDILFAPFWIGEFRACSHGGGEPGKLRYPASVGLPITLLIAFTCEVGYLTEAGCPISRVG